MRLIEIRLLEGPNVYRLEPVVKLELAVGRRRTWYGQRDPGRHLLVRLGATHGINMDGGGSSTMVTSCAQGWCVRNRPSDGRERNVPVGLAIVPSGKW